MSRQTELPRTIVTRVGRAALLLSRASTLSCLLLIPATAVAQESCLSSSTHPAETVSLPRPARSGFTGRWHTTFGVMELRQKGDHVSGHYAFAGGRATLEGTIEEDRLNFHYREPTGASGQGWFELARDGQAFNGRWREREGVWLPWQGKYIPEPAVTWSTWTGKRVGQPVRERTFTGIWDTTFGRMVLSQQGDILYGIYEYPAGRAKIIGTLDKDKFTFSYEEPTGAVGEGAFELAADGQSFAGKWRQTEQVASCTRSPVNVPPAQDDQRAPTAPARTPAGSGNPAPEPEGADSAAQHRVMFVLHTAADERQVGELKALLKKQDAGGIRQFFGGMAPRDKRDFVRAYTGEQDLDQALVKVLRELQKSFAKADEWDEEPATAYDLYLNHVVKGLRKEVKVDALRTELVDYQDFVISTWTNLWDEPFDPNSSRRLTLRPAKREAIRIFLKPLGIASGKDAVEFNRTGEPKAFADWCKRFAFFHRDGSSMVITDIYPRD